MCSAAFQLSTLALMLLPDIPSCLLAPRNDESDETDSSAELVQVAAFC